MVVGCVCWMFSFAAAVGRSSTCLNGSGKAAGESCHGGKTVVH